MYINKWNKIELILTNLNYLL